MPNTAETKVEERRVDAYIHSIEKSPDYSLLFNLRDAATGNRIAPTLLRRMLKDGDSVTIFGEPELGKTSTIIQLADAYAKGSELLGITPAVSINQWDEAKDEAIDRHGPAHTWENYEPVNQILKEKIDATRDTTQLNEVVGLGAGVGENYWDAGASILSEHANETRTARTTGVGKKRIAVGLIQIDEMQKVTETIRDTIRKAQPNQNVVSALAEQGILVQGSQDTPEWDKALREWARKSGQEKHRKLKRKDEEEITEDALGDKDPIYRLDLKGADKSVAPPPSVFRSIKIPESYTKLLQERYKDDPEWEDKVDTAKALAQWNATRMIDYLKELGVPAKDGFAVFNIPASKNSDGMIVVPSPVTL